MELILQLGNDFLCIYFVDCVCVHMKGWVEHIRGGHRRQRKRQVGVEDREALLSQQNQQSSIAQQYEFLRKLSSGDNYMYVALYSACV